ncbi:NAD(P)H-binding protein [Paracoccus sp. YIM 132242]|uniref:NAD(P)H-binding protein n=1 Tax=Paracoccus lichenicola TaxID=2665644 RepID=A0A6L6HX60_9RHOB|nr:NAD(P)H-binding protein [Paracoccus lichenicola]MTE01928.1 NAD(P)H-binding protein [Paracoccus lichenicola]
MDESKRTALVLGATGGVGGAVARALLAHGWAVRGMARDPGKAAAAARNLANGIEWVKGDAMVQDDVVHAAHGTDVIVHGVNPPGYRDWNKLVLPMIDNTIAAARQAGGARIVLPGTIYNFDPAATPVLHENSPQEPRSRKGAIRKELEARLERAARAGEAPALILRAGDFFGPHVRASWFAQAMVAPGKPVKRLTVLNRGVGHSWAYLPDLAETFARLLSAPDLLRTFERVQFEGMWDPDGHRMPEAIAAAVGRPRLLERAFPWWLMQIAAPLGGFPREAVDILPFWRHPVKLDNSRLVALLDAEPRTLLAEALRATLQGMGCLPGAGTAMRRLAA